MVKDDGKINDWVLGIGVRAGFSANTFIIEGMVLTGWAIEIQTKSDRNLLSFWNIFTKN